MKPSWKALHQIDTIVFMRKFCLIFLIQLSFAMPMIILQSHQDELKVMSEIIRADLKSSKANYHAGRLQLLLKYQKDWGMLQCRLRSETNDILVERTFRYEKNDAIWAAHGCSDAVMQGLTGKPSLFSGRVSWVSVDDEQYIVEQVDRHLNNRRVLFKSTSPIISLAWTPDAKSLYYIKHTADAYDIKRYDRVLKTHHMVYHSKTPLNDLVWDATQAQLIFTKSVHGIQKLFTMENGTPRQLTFGKSIDVSPTVSNGKVVFVSDLKHSPMLYKLGANGIKNHLPLEGSSMLMPMMYHHQLYWYDADKGEIMVFDSTKQETHTFINQSAVKAISPTPFGLLVATSDALMLIDFDGSVMDRKYIAVNVLSTSWMDVA